MKILAISDSHGRSTDMIKAIEKHKDEVDAFVHLGDGEEDAMEIKMLFPDIEFTMVRGNNDFTNLPEELVREYGGVRFLLVHGHQYNVNFGVDRLLNHAKELNVNVCVHGHTHKVNLESKDGIVVICPGSISLPRDKRKSYDIITINESDKKIKIDTHYLK